MYKILGEKGQKLTPVSAIMYDVKQQKAEKSRQKEENAV